MPTPPSVLTAKQRRHHKRRSVRAAPPALTLVQAIYPTDVSGTIDLKFDRAINVDAFDGEQVIVKDGTLLGAICNCAGPAELQDAQTVRLYLVNLEDYLLPNQLLSATGASGIVAADDGAAWAGVTDVALPFP
jgi:hypothetical protein